MSSYEKVVKLACKPKAAPPKAKYLDPIIAATWDEGGAVHDVCKALSPRFREPNAIVVFKALIVLHTMIRNGSTDNVLGYLSGSSVLRLNNVSTGSWEGYTAPENLQHYAAYLDARIRAYRDLKHDAVKVQSDTNRDARTTAGMSNGSSSTSLQRSKTLAGRKLRLMTVEKGLLRETRAVHGMLDALVACRFYLDDLEDPLTLTALRMLVKDLLILFQAGNEGVINLLENYFEMSHTDATEALAIYRHFCTQTENVVEYLGVARKLQNLLNVPVPNLKHAPVSLAGALQEYLNDPAFEQNRIEYRTNKDAVKRGGRGGKDKPSTPPVPALPSSTAASSSTRPANGSTPAEIKTPNGKQDALVDFFSAIEDTQPTMFNPATNSPNTAYFQQTAAAPNPFQHLQGQPAGFGAFQPQPTGAFQAQPTGAFPPQNGMQIPQLQVPQFDGGGAGLQPQATGFNPFVRPLSSVGPMAAQATGMGMGAFGQPQQMSNPFGAQPTGALGAQPTGAFGAFPQQQQQQSFLRPQMTGGGAANPFRASMAMGAGAGPVPQLPMMQGSLSAGASPAMNGGGLGSGLRPQMTGGGTANPFRASMMFSQGTGPAALSGSAAPAVPPFVLGNTNNAASSLVSPMGGAAGIARPASAPLSALAPSSPSPAGGILQPVKTHQTGTKNPFGQPAPREEVPALPTRQPTLMEIAMGSLQQQQKQLQEQQQQLHQQQQAQQQLKTQATGFGGSTTKAFDYGSSALGPGSTDISSIASEFAFKGGSTSATGSTMTGTSSDAGSSSLFSAPSFTGTTATSSSLSSPGGGLGGFSSGSFSPTVPSFGGSGSSTPAFNPATSALNSPAGGFNSPSSLTSQPTGGAKAFKPSSSFGASLLEALPPIPGSAPTSPALSTQPTGFLNSGAGSAFGGSPSPGSSVLGGLSPLGASTNPTGAFGAGSSPFGGLSGGFSASPNPTGAFGASTGGFGGASTNPTGMGSTLGVGLRPQMTGGAANPFRASMAMGGAVPPMPTGAMPTGGAFGGSFGGAFGSAAAPPFGSPGQQQQNGTPSLI
ncbi:ANTH domain-containing protein [Roridomyces roridus]|uniref:ANTH domain-containing protein n=1 Tax=Roridomyces roridus TaxID=1738132 RepID=A0AAD7BMN3_9AGAR|nr:ANTH domain-containing protein [Roridomyces roridus]